MSFSKFILTVYVIGHKYSPRLHRSHLS